MINHHIHAALAHERANTFLTEAQARRRARQARPVRPRAGISAGSRTPLGLFSGWLRPRWRRLPAQRPQPAAAGRPAAAAGRPAVPDGGPAVADGTPAVLRDGSKVLIRRVRGSDAPLLADGFARLSGRSRQMRFLSPKHSLSAAELRFFTEVDHYDHEAIGALSPANGRGVGIARYVRDVDDPEAAEIAVTIADDWQGRGLGTELLAQLSGRARQAGICRFTATVAYGNGAMAALLQNMGAELAGHGPGTVDYVVDLNRAGEYSLDWWFRCVDDGPVFSSR
jgi:RimJ/RimL family protein N-acetyltransferase